MNPVWRLIAAAAYVHCAPHVLAEGPDEYIDYILAYKATEALMVKKQRGK